jgi:hypothetical protein
VCLTKYDTVIGIIGNTQGVRSERPPITTANHRKEPNDCAVPLELAAGLFWATFFATVTGEIVAGWGAAGVIDAADGIDLGAPGAALLLALIVTGTLRCSVVAGMQVVSLHTWNLTSMDNS